MSRRSTIGKFISHMSCMPIKLHNIQQQEFHYFLLLYGRQPAPCQFATQLGYHLLSYPAHLQARLAELQDFVHTNLTQAAHLQRSNYDNHTMESTFILGDPVWLSIPTMGKLDTRWEGNG